MGKFAGVWKVLMWIGLVPILGIQVLAMVSIAVGGKMSIVPLVIACVLLLAAAILLSVLPKKKGIALIIAAVAAVLFAVVAVTIYKVFQLNFKVENVGDGISAFDFVYRHLSPLFVPLFMLFYWICWREEYKAEKARREQDEPDHYLDLSDYTMRSLDE